MNKIDQLNEVVRILRKYFSKVECFYSQSFYLYETVVLHMYLDDDFCYRYEFHMDSQLKEPQTVVSNVFRKMWGLFDPIP